jgi:hypothetical protein
VTISTVFIMSCIIFFTSINVIQLLVFSKVNITTIDKFL